jgi:hypothetical protein
MTTLKNAMENKSGINPNLSDKMKQNINKVKSSLLDPSISAYFVPSPKLKEMVLKNDHPIIRKLPTNIRTLILGEYPFYVQNRLVWEFISGETNEDNSFILSNGEIRIVMENGGLVSHNTITGEK